MTHIPPSNTVKQVLKESVAWKSRRRGGGDRRNESQGVVGHDMEGISAVSVTAPIIHQSYSEQRSLIHYKAQDSLRWRIGNIVARGVVLHLSDGGCVGPCINVNKKIDHKALDKD